MDKRKKEALDYWFASSANDWAASESMFSSGHYDWSLFLCHIAIEKAVKGLMVQNDVDVIHTHDLQLLLEKAGVDVPLDIEEYVEVISSFNLEARYDNYKLDFYKKATKKYALEWRQKAEEVYLWLQEKRT